MSTDTPADPVADVPRLVAALEAALALADEWYGPDESGLPSSALTEDREWVRQGCADELRAAIAAALPGRETADG